MIPARLTRPYVGFKPASPHHAAGQRIEPPVSVPIAIAQRPAATAAPDPLDDPAGSWSMFQGLRGWKRRVEGGAADCEFPRRQFAQQDRASLLEQPGGGRVLSRDPSEA